jgi:membrane protein YdbS with pleckstrin-like domain
VGRSVDPWRSPAGRLRATGEYVPDRREVLRVMLLCLGSLVVAVGAWYVSITVVSWVVITVAGFLALMAAYTLYVYAQQARRRRL